jgi:DNA-3-methyladenine glycosylase II
MAFTQTLTINTQEPFDFDLSAQIFAGGDRQVRIFADGCFSQVINIGGKLILVNITSKGTVDKPELSVELKSTSDLSLEEKKKAEETINYIFNLKFPLRTFYEQAKADPIMVQITQKLYGLKNPTTPTVFEALVDSIVEQQISIKFARTVEHRIAKKFGDQLEIDVDTYFAFPTPQNIVNAGKDEIQQVGLSRRKTEYIQEAAKLIVNDKLDLEHLKTHKNPEEIILELDEIRGIGVWTAELTMLRGMQKLDAFPADDFGIRRVISRYYCSEKAVDAGEAREIAKAWGNWKGLAAYYLIIAEAKDLTVSLPG